MAEVIVVGAGPTGLLLAGDLAEAGAAVTLLERRDGHISNLSRAFGVHARTLEQLDARGLADRLVATGAALRRLRLFGRLEVDLGGLPSRFPYLLVTPQFHVEELLLERALKAGAEIVRNAEVTGLEQDGAGVTVTTPGGTYRADYAVGADGFHSAVRRLLGQPFPGRSVLKSIMLADVKVTEEPTETLTVNGVGDSFAFMAPFGDGYYRIFAWDRRSSVPDDAPLSLEEVRDVARRALGTDFGMHDARWLARFHSDERQVPDYRVGRVFLAGDAAHVHSPAGGQGMNTGLQDAANLGWKLAAVLRGAPDGLLDTYQAERHPVGRAVLRSSGAIIRGAMIESPVGRAVRGLVARAALAVPPVLAGLIGQISGVGFAYPRPAGAHELVGTRAADVPLTDGTRLYEALRGGRFVVLGAADVTGWADRVRTAHALTPDAPLVLVRPDGYLGWAGKDPAGLRAALTALAGAPS
ncbi:2-polyprenyl-6-methoxyphenol hydroxylase-like FAD-dependent oxidoreductase [Actinocorallia herbida]|uniref:2-polyprenyl-6-methoxyphenol hydroxylase-like FAD-dependent oxidoreductase n=1 Tax=Actinocorallia herbida TaxID=58109 RepID=A0A3N1CVZ3_9ACTN|nr:FAD-dependent oxidoreductase [Actinocorallia herbida]ROO85463.1 2-polyprenyl-6-methoxyphenol hydroxylase-like FAD-dependent oxidoreductase [Actinocorallia herbida]